LKTLTVKKKRFPKNIIPMEQKELKGKSSKNSKKKKHASLQNQFNRKSCKRFAKILCECEGQG
jgi:hypothetical protein